MSWLSLKVLDSPQGCILISVPKKVVPRAVDRNRLKRLIRESVRRDAYFEVEKCFAFKVIRHAKSLKLENVRKIIDELKTKP